MRRLLLLFLLLLVARAAVAQVVAPGYVHDAWSNADGLPVNTVNAMVQARDGYLWLATFDGLIRFDGHAFTIFNTSNTPGLPSNRIGQLFEDAEGRLWFATSSGAVGYWHQGQVTTVSRETIGQARALGLAQAADGSVWVNGSHGIFQVHGSQLHRVWHDPALPINASIYPEPDGSLWVVSNTAQAAVVRITAADTLRFSRDQLGEVFSVYGDPQAHGVVWIGTSKGGFRYANGTMQPLPSVPEAHRFLRDADGDLYFGTAHQFYRLDADRPTRVLSGPARNDFLYPYWAMFQTAPEQHWLAGPDRLLHNGRTVFRLDHAQSEIRQVLTDREGNVWIATLREGLHRLRPSLFTTYGVEAGLVSPNVYALREEAPGTMWIGTMSGGLARMRGDEVQVWQRPEGVPYLVYDILPDRNGGVWVAGGMLSHSPSRSAPAFEGNYTARLGISETVSEIRALHEDAEGCLWLASTAALYRRCGTVIQRFTTADGLMSNTVQAFLQTRDGTLWMATAGGGIVAYREGRFHPVTTEEGLSSNNVRALYEDEDGYLWVGTEDQGLNRIVRRRGDPTGVAGITTYRPAHGLFDDGIHTILEDDAARLWMSTNRGIFWVTRQGLNAFAEGRERRIFSVGYDESDGLRNREANGGTQSPGLKASDGRLWFATQQGAVVIDPATVRPEATPVPTYIEGVEAETLVATAQAREVRLPRGVRNFDVRYTGIHFTKPQSVRFRYRLGAGEPWVEAGARRTAFFTNVPPGTHRFEVIASAYPGQWPSEGALLTISVPPFFYETGLFRGLLVLLVLVGLAGAYGARVRHLRRREQALNLLVKARTEEVRQEKARAEEALRDTEQARADAEAQRKEAIRQRRIAEEALHQVQAQAAQLQSLDAAKSRFFANISHEFRTPLTLTLGPLEDLQDGIFGDLNDGARQQVQLAHRNAQRLLRLINQLLDLSRLESGTIRLDRKPVNLNVLLQGIAEAFTGLAERKAMTLALDLPEQPVFIEGDASRLEEVFVNLIGNAFKFTADGGTVRVQMRREDETCRVRVSDTGTGIAPEDLPHIFERFYQGRRGQHPGTPGTGIGLALSKELVELHGGALAVTSTPDEGSTFVVTLSVTEVKNGTARPASEVEGSFALGEMMASNGEDQSDDVPEDLDRTTVLVVDDHPDLRAYVRRHLEPDYLVLEAADGAAGLERVRTHLPDLVIADVMMPEVDGYAFCRALKGDPALAFIPVILLTGRASAEDKLTGLDEGADDYLTKPFDVRELRARVDNLIRQRQRLRTLAPAGHGPGPAPGEALSSADAAFVARVRGIVRARLSEADLSVEVLAEEVGLSRTQLYRRLKAVTGQTPTDFLRAVRLAEAARLLLYEAGTVSEVAYGVGFNSIAHFSRVFRAAYGVPPSTYATGLREPEAS